MISIAGTIRSDVGLSKGLQLLLDKGAAIDVVEQVIKIVENNVDDWTVGTGGLPNLLGEVELDASIMNGADLKSGAVAGIKHFKNPISIARTIMEKTPHALLIGEGAERFAEVSGFKQSNILTKQAAELYEDFMTKQAIVKRDYDTEKTLKLKERYYKSFKDLVDNKGFMDWYAKYAKEHHGTVNVIAKDHKGAIVSGVSTSGLSFKLPGRVGDSAIIGAGNYADNKYGAACCVGVGEIAIRLSLARVAVYELSAGHTVEEAAIKSIERINELEEDAGSLSILIMDKEGNIASAANFKPYYYWMANEHTEITKKESLYVKTEGIRRDGGVGYHR